MLNTALLLLFIMTGAISLHTASLNYVEKDTPSIVALRREVTGDDDKSLEDIVSFHSYTTAMKNARERSTTLETHGFDLMKSDPPPVNFLDSKQVVEEYYKHCEQLIESRLGGTAKAFDHNIRSSKALSLENAGAAQAQQPLPTVHADYTAVSAPRRIADFLQPPKANDSVQGPPLLDGLKEEVQECLEGKRRFVLINVWRNIDKENAVLNLPLACCRAESVPVQDLRTLQIHYTDRVGENYLSVPSNDHEWFYYPKMTHSEALLIKTWDSQNDSFSMHTAFEDSSILSEIPRQSIEVRLVCILD